MSWRVTSTPQTECVDLDIDVDLRTDADTDTDTSEETNVGVDGATTIRISPSQRKKSYWM